MKVMMWAAHTVTFLPTALNICDQGHSGGRGGLGLGLGVRGGKQKAGPGPPIPLSIFQSFNQMGPILGFVKSYLRVWYFLAKWKILKMFLHKVTKTPFDFWEQNISQITLNAPSGAAQDKEFKIFVWKNTGLSLGWVVPDKCFDQNGCHTSQRDKRYEVCISSSSSPPAHSILFGVSREVRRLQGGKSCGLSSKRDMYKRLSPKYACCEFRDKSAIMLQFLR